MTEDEMVGWHHQLYGHQFEQDLGVGDGQGSLAFCSPWGRKESDTTEQLNRTELTAAGQTPLSMEFPRQEYWSGLPFPPPGDLPNLGIEPTTPALQADSLTAEEPWKPLNAGFLGNIFVCLLSLDEPCLCEAQYNHVKGAYKQKK